MTYNNSRNEETIDSEDTFSETSLTSEFNKFEKDSFTVFESECEEIIGSEDTFSDASLTSEPNQYEKDSFTVFESECEEKEYESDSSKCEAKEFVEIKKSYLKRKNNIKKECCRRCVESIEDYLLMKMRENELQMRKRKLRTNKKSMKNNKKIKLNHKN